MNVAIITGEAPAYGGGRARLQGGPGPAAIAHPLPQGAVGKPWRPTQSEHAGAARRCAQRNGLCHDRRRTAPDHQARRVVHQLVNKSTTADLRATKTLFDMM